MSPNAGATNSSGYSELPAGYRTSIGAFGSIGLFTNIWSSSESSSANAIFRYLNYGNSDIYRSNLSKYYGFSARCTQD
jgi:uncharacterized protein (TIGR02145 family)